MSAVSPPPNEPGISEREALMMAYVDDELGADDRRRFEAMLGQDPALAAEVADHMSMLELGRAAASLEPTERELRRFWSRFHNRTEWRLGWTLLLGGLAVLAAFGCYELAIAEGLPLLFKAACLSSLLGAGLLLTSALRQRRIQRRLDRYRGVSR